MLVCYEKDGPLGALEESKEPKLSVVDIVNPWPVDEAFSEALQPRSKLNSRAAVDVLVAGDAVILKMRVVVWTGMWHRTHFEDVRDSVRDMTKGMQYAIVSNSDLRVTEPNTERRCISPAVIPCTHGDAESKGVRLMKKNPSNDDTEGDVYYASSSVLMPKYDYDLRHYLRVHRDRLHTWILARVIHQVLLLVVDVHQSGWRCMDLKLTNIAVARVVDRAPVPTLIDFESLSSDGDDYAACTYPHPSVPSRTAYRTPFQARNIMWTIAATVVHVASYADACPKIAAKTLSYTHDGEERARAMHDFVDALRKCDSDLCVPVLTVLEELTRKDCSDRHVSSADESIISVLRAQADIMDKAVATLKKKCPHA
ncbi:hypothetical protein CYMTET_35734 [Cymbomonas tetramitiformis]|uniref:Protein kinase domain-containing protein n=1 Tax=Cymbomonas tetramitiformis TaxID=36881 RepID=A0AAE0KNK9_9CHLO|nr:hypothetical protein CYMTET_35734 [Cymbomonas tetramitiformis]